MKDFIVSARKYRPQTFDDVVGQRALTDTLKRAITSHKLASAYLFCGPRGVGKTTCARIFAKAINCLNPHEDGEACNACESCVSFNEQRSMNIQELNAAANNSVDDVRVIIDQVRIPPQLGKYKVIILDEVHMLSPSAANALLKTLEEPPSYVIFILATTEKQKILPTILSRCQIFDFNRMEIEDIIGNLKMVAEKEGITYEENALNLIAQKADGGMRDALSIFDQVTNFSGGNITHESVLKSLNFLDYDYYFQMTEILLEHRVSAALMLFNDIVNKGFDGGVFMGGLASHLRNLLVSRDEETVSLLDVAANLRTRYAEQAKQCPLKFLYYAIARCDRCSNEYKNAYNKRLAVEITLIETAQFDEEDPGAGARPQKTLKPLFRDTNVKAATSMPKSAAQSTPVSPAAKPEATVAAHPGPSAQQAAEPAVPAVSKKSDSAPIPKVTKIPKINLNPSTLAKTVPSEDKTPEPASEAASPALQMPSVLGEVPFGEKELLYYWQQFALLLDKEDHVASMRLQGLELKLKENEKIEVAVFNEMLRNLIRPYVPRIEAYLQQQLNNHKIRVEIKLVEISVEQLKRYDPKEQFEEMMSRNEALSRLQKDLNLQVEL